MDRLAGMGDLGGGSAEGRERVMAAVVKLAAGRLDQLDQALRLARLDWRDLLVAADLAHEGWAARLSAWLGAQTPADAASPGSRGELVEPDGRRWLVRRRRLDLRLVKRLLHRAEVAVVLGEAGGSRPRRVAASERIALWEEVRRAYAGPGGSDQTVDGPDYLGYEFTGDDGAVLLYLEQRR
jgi:hypothetical protein